MSSPAGKKEAIEAVYPLTPLQEGLLFHSIYAPGTGEYHDQFSALLRGPLRPDLLESAWTAVVGALPVLRTAFTWKSGGAPLQAVLRRVETPLRLEDWRGQSPAEQARGRERLRQDDLSRPFDLSRAPLTRVMLIRLTDDEWFLLWSRHHLLLDGWSVSLVLRAWLGAYGQLVRGEPIPALTAPSFQSYVEWLKRQDPAAAQVYWSERLAGVESSAGLGLATPAGAALPAGFQRHGEIEAQWSDERGGDALSRLAKAAQVTPAAILTGAWALLLARLSSEREVIFGTTVSGRPAELPGVESMVGLFINTIPLRIRVQPHQSLAAWLQGVQTQAAEARQFESTPLVQIQGWSGVPRDRALFESLLVVENYPAGQALAEALGGVRVESARSHERTHYPVTLIAAPGAQLGLRLLYDRSRLSDDQARQWLDGLQHLLREMVRHPQQPLGRFSVLDAEAEAKWLEASNPALQNRDRTATIISRFADQAARTPNAVAVLSPERQLTYAQLRAEARRLAARLVAAGAGRERCIGVCLERSADLVVALLAVLESGAAYVPLDPAYPPDRLAFMAADAELTALITRPALAGRLPGSPVPRIDPGAPPSELPARDWEAPLPGNLAYLIYTSGSTGRPKAAALEHRQATALIDWALETFSRQELSGMLFSTSISFDLSIFELYVTLAAGGTVIVAENALALPTLPARDAVTLLNSVPSAAAELARQEGLPPGLTTICLAGETMTAALADRLYSFPGVKRVCDLYGPSEDTTFSTYTQRVPGQPATIGRVIVHSRLYLLDDDLAVTPPGAVGEIHLAGEGLARGYLGRPDLTADRFMPDPFSPAPGGRLYRTGDLARFRPDGQLEFLGRRDHQVKIRGFRIELGEIQARLCAHPAVAEAAVLAREHAGRGKYLAAFVVPKAGKDVRADELGEWIRASLPAYMLPAAWHFLPRLPLTPNGKLDRAKLPPDGAAAGPAESGPHGSDPIEEIVGGIWAEVLALGSVEPLDNFFELGGHSLLATQAIARVRRALQIEVPLRALFEHPTLSGFAALVRSTRLGLSDSASAPIPARPAEAPPPLSLAQERMWALARLAGDGAYHVPAVLELRGELDAARLQEALNRLIDRHEALRMSFPEREGRAEVRISDHWAGALRLENLTALEPGEREAAAARIAAEESWAPFDLANGPLLRARLLQLEPSRAWLLLTVHHIATDGWSEWILVRELGELYAGRELDPTPVRYGDFALWQRGRVGRGELADQIEWWKGELAGLPALEWPGAPASPRTQRGGRIDERLDEIGAEKLRGLARRENATLFMVLLAVWEIWLWRRTGMADFGVGAPVAGRMRRDCEALVGLLVNTIVLRSDIDEELTFAGLVGKTRERTLRAFDRQEAPFAQVIEAVQPRRDLARSPLFQVMFVLQNNPQAELELGAVKATAVPVAATGAKFDLSFIAAERTDGSIGLSLEFSRDRWSEAAAAAALAEIVDLIREVTEEGGGQARLRRWAPPPELARVPRREEPVPTAPADPTFVPPRGPVETLLAQLWEALLPAERVGRLDNFFARGGDSILALQVAARAAKAGYQIPAQAVFEHQTVAELAGCAVRIEGRERPAPFAGDVLLTPIQRWFFERRLAQPAHWNQSALFVTAPGFEPDRLAGALTGLVRRHEALRLSFSSPPAASGEAAEPAVRIEPEARIELERMSAGDLTAAIARAQAGLDPAAGLLLRALWAEPAHPGGEGRLFLVVHHLAIDIVSWSVLIADLIALYSAPATPLPPAPSWAHWTRALAAEALAPTTLSELEFWQGRPASPALPRDLAAETGRGLERDAAVAEAALTAPETERLLGWATGAYHAQPNELLLSALALALQEWTGSNRATVALENHGREDLPGSPGVAGAIGWFTALFPVTVELDGIGEVSAAVAAVKTQLRAVPRRGLGYGLLRYNGPPEARALLGAQTDPEICLNYAGTLDSAEGMAGFRAADEPRGSDHGPANERPFLLEIFAAVRGGALRWSLSYSRTAHTPATARRLVERVGIHLRALIPEEGGAEEAAPSASDFSPSGMSAADLQKILSRM